MTVAIIIGSVVTYLAGAGVIYGFLHSKFTQEPGGDMTPPELPAGFYAALWPLAVPLAVVLFAIVPRVVALPVRLGRRLATPKPQLPEARVVSGEEKP